MKPLLRLLFMLAIAASLVCPAPGARAGSKTDVVPDGYFYPEDLPAAFGHIAYLELWTSKPGPPPDYAPRPTPLSGSLLIGRRAFRLVKVSIDGRALTFATEAVRGTSYAFRGSFLRGGEFAAQDVDGRVLKGQLTKATDGKSPASAEVAFTYFVGD